MGLFITEAKSVVLASLIIAGSGAVGCSDSPTISIGPPPCVNYTEFVESDPDNHITVSENLIEVTDLDRNSSTNIRADVGEGFIGTQFTHYTSVTIDSTPDDTGILGYWGVSANPHNSITEMWQASDGIVMYAYYSATGPAINITAYPFDNETNGKLAAFSNPSLPVTYYIKIVRDGAALSVYIYSDATYTTLLDSITAVDGLYCHETNTYRYLYGLISFGESGTAAISGDVGCLGVSSELAIAREVVKSESLSVVATPTVQLNLLKISASETVGVADDPSRYINPLVVTKTETIGVSDSRSEGLTPLIITKTETIKVKEGRQYSSLWPEGEEIVSVTDSPTLELSFLRVSQSDSVAATDSKTLTRDLRISQSDNLSVIGSSTLEINPLVVTNCDDVSISEQRTLGYDLIVVKSEGVGVSGVDTTRIAALLVEGSDEVGVAEVVAGVTDAIGAVSDEAGIVDSNTVEVKAPETCEPALSEGVGASDSAVVRLGWLSVVKSEQVGIGEAKSFINDLAVPRMDGVSVTDVPTVSVNDLAVHQTDPVSVNDGEASGEVDLDKRDLESVGISEEITVKFSAAGAVKSEGVGVSDSPSAWVPPFPRGSDSVGISEARTLGFDPLRVEKAEQVGVSGGLVGTRFSLLVSKTDQVSLSETRTALPETVDL